MPSAEPGFVTFGVLHTDGARASADAAAAITAEVREWVRHAPGFVSSRVHLGVADDVVVHRGEWTDPESYRTSFQDSPAAGRLHGAAGWPGVTGATVFRGAPAAGISGPAAGRRPGTVVVATRHLSGPAATAALLGLLHGSGEWKRDSPGFVSATPYVDADGRTFVNYPVWVDRAAYDAWMADPRIPAGQQEIARLEVAPPEYLLCTVVSDIAAAPAAGTPRTGGTAPPGGTA
ncbi:putative quinol monooxygenase [Actinacidiphila bryophytorum]|uniref:ABM domain-containing protein n=1 Tax=Actinacidiphila bryophytorum TaxID=1436133 RepID=A0A9W4MKD9_9ACTN|nr:antibiotic biosynthesis monooxygenase [Actinacidiphila bryophytorum]MBM9438272.1 antibiotic biosynthesis monooxygenase [Actinacidiphila bryophytorum]MBN6545439.1 antibiotic biosynthesis monooxygenase [Actinacidiphila bryophytorum]CAG7657833.1 ABM domain-containing protein [Actinacidiphila bryophytorum]